MRKAGESERSGRYISCCLVFGQDLKRETGRFFDKEGEFQTESVPDCGEREAASAGRE